MRMSIRAAAVVAPMLALAAGVPVSADNVVRKGVDAWTTVKGFTQTSFAKDPIPAGFFCEGSQPFTGTIVMKGAPLATKPAQGLGEPADTVVARLDDAVFNAKGEATTRIQLKALSLAGLEPIETGCGLYDVSVRLDGEQPVTTMKIVKTSAKGGSYEAPLALNVKVVFTPVTGDVKGVRELSRRVNLGPGTHSVWTFAERPRYEGSIWIDSDGNGKPDMQVRGSNFVAGISPGKGDVRFATYSTYSSQPACPPGYCAKQSCHCNPNDSAWDPDMNRDGCSDEHLHCVWVCVAAPGGSASSPSPGPGLQEDFACAFAEDIDEVESDL
ncbi:MAG TPA: hypothetical protein VEL74_18695 [Thermoanaerobaculia bacterium]|nr:hypothetical protein [Thermoanaerobaculia bacterium]